MCGLLWSYSLSGTHHQNVSVNSWLSCTYEIYSITYKSQRTLAHTMGRHGPFSHLHMFFLLLLSLHAEHTTQTTLLHRALSWAAEAIFFQLYLKPVTSSSFSRSLFHVFHGLPVHQVPTFSTCLAIHSSPRINMCSSQFHLFLVFALPQVPVQFLSIDLHSYSVWPMYIYHLL